MKQPIVIGCDPGQDDALSLLLAWGSDAVDLLAITTVGGNCSARQGAVNALGLCALARRDIPVAVGIDRDDAFVASQRSYVHGPSGIEGFDRPDAGEPVEPLDGPDMILRHISTTPGVIVCALGPLTNVAEAIRRDRRAFDGIKRIAIMGGGTERSNRTPAAEFNIWVDPEAAATVFASGLPISLVGLNVTYRALVPHDVIARLGRLPNRCGPAVAGLLARYGERYRARYGFAAPPVHDLVVLADIIEPGIVSFTRTNVEIELDGRFTRGATVIDLKNVTGRSENADVAVEIDTPRLLNLLMASIAKLP